MAVDPMYLENLDEYINDNAQLVTYKWLSNNLHVHVNHAKQMLFSFVQRQRNKSENDSLNVTYLVTGFKKNDDGSKTHVVRVLPEENCDAFKQSLDSVTSCHIYSVKKGKLLDSNLLYTADYDMMKDNLYNSNKYGCVTYKKAKIRSEDDMKLLIAKHSGVLEETETKTSNGVQRNSNGDVKKANGTHNNQTHTEEKKPVAKKEVKKEKGIAGMFANATKKAETSSKAAPKAATNSKDGGKGKAKQAGVMSMFANQTAKAKNNKMEKPKNEDKPKEEDKRKEEETKVKEASKPHKEAPVSKRGKKKAEEDNSSNQKKRRRIQVWESSSDEDEEMEVDRIPTPPPEPEPVLQKTPLSSPAKQSSVESPRKSPQSSPRKSPQSSPRKSPRSSPSKSPQSSPRKSPRSSPSKSPQSSPRKSPRSSPSKPVVAEEAEKSQMKTTAQSNGGKKRVKKRKLVDKTTVDDDGYMVTEKVYEEVSTDESDIEVNSKPNKTSKTQNKPVAESKKKKASPKKKSPAKNKKQPGIMNFFKKK